ncbi:hypothetical protein CSUI_002246 [Cystoisospora suis]|uniref:Ph domain protein n=1 Tax=Cystoisospora suis TaxID=483139 RepID=A0A2C6L9R2_9APIC|nr:hypothetical protein CSUI_002246 [Cystoisospora suis]
MEVPLEVRGSCRLRGDGVRVCGVSLVCQHQSCLIFKSISVIAALAVPMPACNDSGGVRTGVGVAASRWDMQCRAASTNGSIPSAVQLSCRAVTPHTPQSTSHLSWRKWRPFCRPWASTSSSCVLEDDFPPPRSYQQVLVTGSRGRGSVFSSTDFSGGSVEPSPVTQRKTREQTTTRKAVRCSTATVVASKEQRVVSCESVIQPCDSERVQPYRPHSELEHMRSVAECEEVLKCCRSAEGHPISRGRGSPGRARPQRGCVGWRRSGDAFLFDSHDGWSTVTQPGSCGALTSKGAAEPVELPPAGGEIAVPEMFRSRSFSLQGSRDVPRKPVARGKVGTSTASGERRAVSLGQYGTVLWTDWGTSRPGSRAHRVTGAGPPGSTCSKSISCGGSSMPVVADALLSNFATASAGCSVLPKCPGKGEESRDVSAISENVMSGWSPSTSLTCKKMLCGCPSVDLLVADISRPWRSPAALLSSLSDRCQQDEEGVPSRSRSVQVHSASPGSSPKPAEAQRDRVRLCQLERQLLDVRGGSVFVTRSAGRQTQQLFPLCSGAEEKSAGHGGLLFLSLRKSARRSSVAVAGTMETPAQTSGNGDVSRCACRSRHPADEPRQVARSPERASCRDRPHVWNSQFLCSGEKHPTGIDAGEDGVCAGSVETGGYGGDNFRCAFWRVSTSTGMGPQSAAVVSLCGREGAVALPGSFAGANKEAELPAFSSTELARREYERAQDTHGCGMSHTVGECEEPGQVPSSSGRCNTRCDTGCCGPRQADDYRRECVVSADRGRASDSKSDSDSTRCSAYGEPDWVSRRSRLVEKSSLVDTKQVRGRAGLLVQNGTSTPGRIHVEEKKGQIAQMVLAVREGSGENPSITSGVDMGAVGDRESGAGEQLELLEPCQLISDLDSGCSQGLRLLLCEADVADSMQELESDVAGLGDVEAMLRYCAPDFWDAQEVDVYVAPTLHGLQDQSTELRCTDTAAAAALAAAVAATGALASSSPAEEGAGGFHSSSESETENCEYTGADDETSQHNRESFDARPNPWVGHQATRWSSARSEGGPEDNPTVSRGPASRPTGTTTTTASSVSSCAPEYGSCSSTSAPSAASERSDGSPASSFRRPSGQKEVAQFGGIEWCGRNSLTNCGCSWAGGGQSDKRSLHSDLLVVKFKYSSLMVQDEDGVLGLDTMPSFEGPLYVINPPSTRRTPAYSRLLKSLPYRRLFFFILSRGHLFWFRSSREFVARGFGAAAGSLSLIINHCHVDVIDSSGTPGGRFRLEIKDWGRVLELQTVTGSQGGGSGKHRRRRSRAEAESSRGAWVQQLLATMQKGEQIRNRFQKVDWTRTQHHAMLVADRLGVM